MPPLLCWRPAGDSNHPCAGCRLGGRPSITPLLGHHLPPLDSVLLYMLPPALPLPSSRLYECTTLQRARSRAHLCMEPLCWMPLLRAMG